MPRTRFLNSVIGLQIQTNLLEDYKILFLIFRYLSRITSLFGLSFYCSRSENCSIFMCITRPAILDLVRLEFAGKTSLCIGSGAFWYPGYLNYDLPAKTMSYFYIQGVPYIDYLPEWNIVAMTVHQRLFL